MLRVRLDVIRVIDEPTGQGGERQQGSGDTRHRRLLSIHRGADSDRLAANAVATKISTGHRGRHRRHNPRHHRGHGEGHGGHRSGTCRRNRRSCGCPLRGGRRHGEGHRGIRPRPLRTGCNLGEKLLPGLFHAFDETSPGHLKRSGRNRPQQIQPGFRGPQDHQRIGLLRRHSQQQAGISRMHRIDAKPLPAGVEGGVCRHDATAAWKAARERVADEGPRVSELSR